MLFHGLVKLGPKYHRKVQSRDLSKVSMFSSRQDSILDGQKRKRPSSALGRYPSPEVNPKVQTIGFFFPEKGRQKKKSKKTKEQGPAKENKPKTTNQKNAKRFCSLCIRVTEPPRLTSSRQGDVAIEELRHGEDSGWSLNK